MAAATCEQVDNRYRRNVTKTPFAHLKVRFIVFGVLLIYDTGKNLKKVEPAFRVAGVPGQRRGGGAGTRRAVVSSAFEGRPYSSVPLMCQQGSVL
ncbi:hypothetical protein ACFWSF_37610 [Streptomyces sp. NPDC058611]|uniref:hypothetical protein n=1 Tax=unclassified Streptomyces TaxID=2593676 RepID=UPI00366177FD